MAGASSLRVLIDGAYREQRQGTGISTYARTLAAALKALGHSVSWLSGADAPFKGEAVADEALFSDAPPPVRGLREHGVTAQRMAEGVLTNFVQARPVASTGLVMTDPSAPKPDDTYLAPNLYVRAHYRHMLLKKFLEVRLPDRFDVLHLTAPLPVYVKGPRYVVTIHDLVPLRLPYTTPDNKTEFLARVRMAAMQADLVVTVSEASRKDIVDVLGVDPGKVEVTYQSSDLQPLAAEELGRLPGALGKYGLEPGGYALFVGALEPKKNLRRMIEAFLEVDAPDPLVICGPKAWMWEKEIGDLGAVLGEKARKRLRILGHVERDDLRRLYAGAKLFLFASLYEGFGLPALDALRFGVPLLTSNNGSLPEVVGDAALKVDPFDRNAIRDGVETLLGDAALRAKLTAAGPAQAARFSFEAYVERLGRAYARLA